MSQLLRCQAVLEAKAMQAGEEWEGTPKLGRKDGLQTAPSSLTTCLYKQYGQMKPAVSGPGRDSSHTAVAPTEHFFGMFVAV